MPQINHFLDERRNLIVEKYSKENKLSKAEAINKIIDEWEEERK